MKINKVTIDPVESDENVIRSYPSKLKQNNDNAETSFTDYS